jgi:hypothetical protein
MQVHLVTPYPEESAVLPHFRWDNITIGDYTETRVIEYDITFPPVRLSTLFHFTLLRFLFDSRF